MQLDRSSSTIRGLAAPTGQSTHFAARLKTFKHDELPKPLQRALGRHVPTPPTYLYGISCSQSFLFDYAMKHDIKYANDQPGWEIDRVVEAITDTMQKAFNCPYITIEPLDATEQRNHKYGIAVYTNQATLVPKLMKKREGTSVEEVILKIQEATGIRDEPVWHPSIGVVPQDLVGL